MSCLNKWLTQADSVQSVGTPSWDLLDDAIVSALKTETTVEHIPTGIYSLIITDIQTKPKRACTLK